MLRRQFPRWPAIATFLFLSAVAIHEGIAQSVASASSGERSPGTDSSIFAPLTLPPAPSAIRLADGAPGPKYWQNRADYDLQATLDTGTHTVHGSMTLRYTNHSPDTLPILWMQTEQDPNEPIQQFVQSVHGKPVALTLDNHNTETKVTLAEPITPG
ncbi:MAG TPA: hypothetical protein VNU46_05260, partial [Gemmatimonadaceae bacterium]|nr:hypothetical protein [Gemmatimonadaceae bacterium]